MAHLEESEGVALLDELRRAAAAQRALEEQHHVVDHELVPAAQPIATHMTQQGYMLRPPKGETNQNLPVSNDRPFQRMQHNANELETR